MFGVLLFLASFWLVFLSTRSGEGKRVLYSLGVTTYLFRRKTRAFAMKKEERRAKELWVRGRESVRWSFHTFIYYCSIYHSSSRERENFFPFFQGEKRRRLVVHRFCERHARGKKALRKEEETVLVRSRWVRKKKMRRPRWRKPNSRYFWLKTAGASLPFESTILKRNPQTWKM